MEKYHFNLLAIDVVESLDDKFYVIDFNGSIGISPSIINFQDEFNKSLINLFGENYYFECYDEFVNDPEFGIMRGVFNSTLNGVNNLNKGLDKNSLVVIHNDGFPDENKLKWRSKYEFESPLIGNDVKIHNHPDYPKFLIKPTYSYSGRGIKLYNQKKFTTINNNQFIEQFITCKLINNHCYHSRLIIIHNEYETFPILHLNKLCPNPIIRNLNEGLLTEEESLSYISNKVDLTNPNFNVEKKEKWQLNTDKRFEKFCLDLVDEIKSKSISYNPNYLEEIKKLYSDKIDMINFLKNF